MASSDAARRQPLKWQAKGDRWDANFVGATTIISCFIVQLRIVRDSDQAFCARNRGANWTRSACPIRTSSRAQVFALEDPKAEMWDSGRVWRDLDECMASWRGVLQIRSCTR